MTAYPAKTGSKIVQTPRGATRWNPKGQIQAHGDVGALRGNPPSWSSRVTYAARLFVGFCVESKECYSMSDLVALVRKFRRDRGRPEDGTFITQRGVYTHRSGKVVDEASGQVIIFDQPVEGDEAAQLTRLEEEMIALAEEIAREFRQEEVILEIQRNGQTVVTMGVTP
jgi:hypothetical protein